MTADFDRGRVDLAREGDFQLGPIHVRPAIRQVESGGASETLEPRIMQVLVVLARRRGEVVSRDDLIETCWEGRVVGDDALNRCVAKIRKIGEASGAFRLETIPRVGYRMHVAEAADGAPAGPAAPIRAASGRGALRFLQVALRPPVLIAALAAMILIGGAVWWINVNSRTVEVAPAATLAVLRFGSPPDEPELKRIAGAISTEVASELTKAGHTVVAPALSMDLADNRKADAGRILGARLLVDGDVSREGDRIRASIRLDHAGAGFTLWSSAIDGDPGEPGAVARRLGAQLLQKLSLRGVFDLAVSDSPGDAERSRAWFRIIQQSDEGNDREAMRAAEQFVALWPEDAGPFYMLTIETMDVLFELGDADRVPAYRKAREAAARSLELPDVSASQGPYDASARVIPSYAWGERIAAFEAINVNGQTITPIPDYMRTGRIGYAAEKMGDGPLRAKSGLVMRSTIYLLQNDRSRSKRDADDGAFIYPLHPFFPRLNFESAAWLGSPDDAEMLLENAGHWRLQDMHRDLLLMYLAARRTPDTRRVNAVEDMCGSQAVRRDDTALLYCFSALANLGRTDAAFDAASTLFPDIRPASGESPETARWLSAPAAALDPVVLYMPWTKSLRADPRIIEVFERLGLLDYWRQSGNWPDFCETEPQSVCAQMKAGAPARPR